MIHKITAYKHNLIPTTAIASRNFQAWNVFPNLQEHEKEEGSTTDCFAKS
jgi:hypothetical protein